ECVRYDGKNKPNRIVLEELAPAMERVGICPEVECGFTTPREPMNLEGDLSAPRLITVRSRRDFTLKMRSFAVRKAEELAQENLSGFILKARSPSCGAAVRLGDSGAVTEGLFYAELRRRLPELPIIDEESLADPEKRLAFLKKAASGTGK
ncbi:MAG: DUF523 domain-containing protein, partial [Victivallaceae bacterium]|nr:DUF523 domain-containing protein [Victivallaceae bacterium]